MANMVLATLVQGTGAHPASWLRTGSTVDASLDIDFYIDAARICEQGKFDLFFIADTPGVRTDNLQAWSKYPFYTNVYEPLTLLSAIAGATKQIGLGGTVSTSFFEPYNVARMFVSLDHLSHGRAAWNVVTSADDYAARNFGLDRLPPHDQRYERAKEFVHVVKRLWDSWEDDAFVHDRTSGLYFDPAKMHVVDHQGKHFSVNGALNIARAPQGHPVIIQAGASDAGKEFAAETAEIVFASDVTFDKAKLFYDDLKGRLPKYGRAAGDLKILAGMAPVVGATAEEAEAKFQDLQRLIHPDVARMRVGRDLEVDLSGLPMDEPIPLELIPEKANFHQAYFNQIVAMIRSGMTLRQISLEYERGIATVRGTPQQIADHMEEWFSGGVCDGFMFIFYTMPGLLRDFVELVVPELQRRGLVQTDYSGDTMRERLGLSRPAHPCAAPAAVPALATSD
ncbi:MAG TPA: LLM class flavin-dependent oxidoreductase [Hansschlegelia sp.]